MTMPVTEFEQFNPKVRAAVERFNALSVESQEKILNAISFAQTYSIGKHGYIQKLSDDLLTEYENG